MLDPEAFDATAAAKQIIDLLSKIEDLLQSIRDEAARLMEEESKRE